MECKRLKRKPEKRFVRKFFGSGIHIPPFEIMIAIFTELQETLYYKIR